MNELVELLLKFLRSELFTILASISSIISLILTFYVFLDVRKIRSYYVFAARVPGLVEKLQQHASNILDYWRNFDKSTLEIKMELASAEVVLESLKNKVDSDTKKSVTQLIKEIKKYNRNKNGKDDLLEIHLEMSRVIGRIKEIQEDRKWEV